MMESKSGFLIFIVTIHVNPVKDDGRKGQLKTRYRKQMQ